MENRYSSYSGPYVRAVRSTERSLEMKDVRKSKEKEVQIPVIESKDLSNQLLETREFQQQKLISIPFNHALSCHPEVLAKRYGKNCFGTRQRMSQVEIKIF